jgi:hypothetical protein
MIRSTHQQHPILQVDAKTLSLKLYVHEWQVLPLMEQPTGGLGAIFQT